MTPDIRTLALGSLVVEAAAGLMVLVYAARHRTYPGLRTFAWSALAAAASTLAFAARGPLPLLPSVVLANALNAAAGLARVDAFLRFERGWRLPPRVYGLVAVFVAVQVFFLVVRDDLVIRVLLVDALGFGVFATSAAILFRTPGRPRDSVRLAMAWCNASLALAMVARSVLWEMRVERDLYRVDPAYVAFLVLLIAYETAQAVGFVMLNGERLEGELKESTRELAAAHADLGVLRGLLPICASCKSIRGPDGRWETLEAYVHSRTEARFSHGLCPACLARLYPEFAHSGGDDREAGGGDAR